MLSAAVSVTEILTTHSYDLGTLGGAKSCACSINDQDIVVGGATTPNGDWHAFIWSKAAGIQDLGLPDKFSCAYGINNQGSIVGYRGPNLVAYDPGTVGFLRTAAGAVVDVPEPELGAGFVALALNDKDEVVGWHGNPGLFNGIFWGSSGKVTRIFLQISNWAFAVNSSGTVVGTEWSSQRAYRWKDGAGVQLNPLPGDNGSWAKGINDKGVIVGQSWNVSDQLSVERAVIWIAGVPRNLNLLAANMPVIKMEAANWIANTGTIVGLGTVNGAYHPFIALPRDDLNTISLSDIGSRGSYLNVLGGIPADGSGVVITPDGHVIPGPPPDPFMFQLRSAMDSALSAIQNPELRRQMESRLLAAVESFIREGSGSGGH